MHFMTSVWEPDLAEVHDECPCEHDPPPHRSVNVPEPEGEEQTVERLVAHLAAQVEHQVPQVVPDLNKTGTIGKMARRPCGCPGGTPGSTKSFLSE
jgi:hypothetical protein